MYFESRPLNAEDDKVRELRKKERLLASIRNAKGICKMCAQSGAEFRDQFTHDKYHEECYNKIRRVAPGVSGVKHTFQSSAYRNYPEIKEV